MSDCSPQLVPSPRPDPPARLYSWRAVAAYLGREEHTVCCWEKTEGLPVHRLQHGKSGSHLCRHRRIGRSDGQRAEGIHPAPQIGGATARSKNRSVFLVNPPKFVDLWGNPYPTNPTCALDDLSTPEKTEIPFNLDQEKLFFIFRTYMEPSTLVGPDDNELVYDRAIYFGPYFAKQ